MYVYNHVLETTVFKTVNYECTSKRYIQNARILNQI